jgi:hypothetical protein
MVGSHRGILFQGVGEKSSPTKPMKESIDTNWRNIIEPS